MKRIISLTLVFLMMITFVPVLKAEGTNLIGISINDGAKSKELTVDFKKLGGKLEAKVYAEGITNLETRARKDTVFYQQDDYNNNLKPNVENKGDYFLYTCTIPKNETESDVVWTIEFKGEKWSSGGKINVRVSGKEDSGEEPNPGETPIPGETPTPTPGEDTNKAQILGMDMGDGNLVKTFTENIENKSKTYTAIVKTKNVDKLQVSYKVNGMYNKPGVKSNIIKLNDNEYKVTIIVDENFAKSCKKFEIMIGHGELPGDYSDGIKLNINIDGTTNLCTPGGNDEDPIERVATISRVSDTEDIKDDVLNMEIDSKEQDKKVYLTLINGDILKDGELDAIVKKDGVTDFSIKTTFTGSNNARVASIHFPENTSDKDITYEVTFMIKYKLQNGKKLTIIQKKKSEEEKQASIELFTLTNENIPLSGGSVRASAFGENMDLSKLSLKVFDGANDVSDAVTISPFTGRVDVATSEITFKESKENKAYTIKLYYDSEEKFIQTLDQNEYGSNNPAENMQANRVIKVGNKIIAEFTHDIFEAYPNALKENTEIAFNGDVNYYEKPKGTCRINEPKYEKIGSNDTVEVQGNKIVVTLNEEREFKNNPRIRFGFRTFKDHLGRYNGRKGNQINSYLIELGNGIILSADFISDKVFTSEGGDVELKIHGIELSDDENLPTHTRVKIIKMENLKKDSDQTEVPYTIEGNGSEQTLKFTLPENKSDRTESYTVMLSTDGRVYLSNVNATANDRANLLVVSVLPEGKTKDDMTFGFARIQSYGTNGGSNEKPDITHTTPPLGQESKKTWLTIYGTNLKNPMTKVRAKAEVPAGSEKYVYWYPVNEGTQDSGDKFIMVGVSKGLYGKDNVQMLEVIAPRGYRGDITYTYEIAIDGVNYDTELTTTVTLLDDGEDQGIRKKHEEYVRDLPIKYEDESGNEIKGSENIYVMKNMPLRVVGIDKAPQIDGYKYKELKGLNKDLNNELAKIDMLRKLAEAGTITEEERQELAKLEQWVKDHKDIEFDTVIGDIKELVFVYEKEEYVDIPDPLFLKVINKNLDPNRPDNQKVTKKEMESLTLISHWLDNDGKPGIKDDANKSILGTPKSLEGTDEFKFMISYGIKSIEGIQYAKNLKQLKLNENEISDISYLKDLEKLEYLEISRNRIVDLKPLEGLTNLTFLKLYNNWIEDLTPIKGLTNLTGLDVHNNVRQKMVDGKRVNSNGISDISMLKDLTKLNFLDVSANNLKEVSIIKMFPDIKDMDLSGNHIETYEGLGEYIANKQMQVEMGIGSLNFWAQSVTEDEPIKVSGKELEFDNKYKGYKELFTTLIKKMNEDEEPSDEDALQMAQEYTMVETNLDGVDASYDLKTNKIKLNLSDDFLKENKDKLVDAQIKFTFAYAYEWSLNVKLDLREEKPEPEPQPKPEPEPLPVPEDDEVVRPRRPRKPIIEDKKEEAKPEEKPVEVKAEEKKDLAKEELPIIINEATVPVELNDIAQNEYTEAISNVVSRGILKGTSQDKFSPERAITRAMVTEVFMRIAKDKSIDPSINFTDVSIDAWYANSVKWAVTKNLVKGYANSTFMPNKKVNRQEFALMLIRMLKEYNINLPSIVNVDAAKYASLPNWSKDAVIKAVEEGLIKIELSGKYSPTSEVSREELAYVLDKIINFLLNK